MMSTMPIATAPRTRYTIPATNPCSTRLIASGHPLYCGGRRKREVALTFDDGPGPFTFQLLRALRRARRVRHG